MIARARACTSCMAVSAMQMVGPLLLVLVLVVGTSVELAAPSPSLPLLSPPQASSALAWIQTIERGPPGRRYVLNASTYLIDRQYPGCPPGPSWWGPGRTTEVAVVAAVRWG